MYICLRSHFIISNSKEYFFIEIWPWLTTTRRAYNFLSLQFLITTHNNKQSGYSFLNTMSFSGRPTSFRWKWTIQIWRYWTISNTPKKRLKAANEDSLRNKYPRRVLALENRGIPEETKHWSSWENEAF